MNNDLIVTLKGELPEFDAVTKAGMGTPESPALKQYFSLYNFASLDGACDTFHLGSIDSGSYRIACFRWAHRNAKAEVVLAHGLFDHVGLYIPLIKMLLAEGVNVVAFDLPEHGISSGEFGEVADFAIYAQALTDVMDQLALGEHRPLYAIGQSTGAAVLMNYLLHCEQKAKLHRISKLILMAPLLRVRGWRKIKLTYLLLHKWVKKIPRSFTVNSHDEAFCTFLKKRDPLQPRVISVPWVKAMLDWSKLFSELNIYALPGGIIQGSDDLTVNAEYNLVHIKQKFPQLSVTEIEGAHHHLVRESEPLQAKVFKAVAKLLAN